MAAPAVSGAIALVLAEASTRQMSLSSHEIWEIVQGTAVPSPPPVGAWHPRYGIGRLNVRGTVQRVIDHQRATGKT